MSLSASRIILAAFAITRAAAAGIGQLGFSAPVVSVPLKKQYAPMKRNGTIVAYKTAYFGELRVGSPAQTFTAVFDTGSGHLILPSDRCFTETCMKHSRYDRKASTTSQDIGSSGKPIHADAKTRDQVAITFGTGKVVGEFVQDHVCVGSSSETCFSLSMVVANDMTHEPFGFFDFDGILGLGLSALALNPQFSFFGQMAAQHPSMEHIFSVFLARNEQEGESLISFGGYEERYAASELKWAPVAMQDLRYWQVQILRVRVGSTILEECAEGDCRAVLDTGTSLLGVPKVAANSLQRLLARPVPDELVKADEDVDCRTIQGPELFFDLADGLTVSLSAEDHSRPLPMNVSVTNASATPLGNGSVGVSSSASFDGTLVCKSLLLPVNMPPPLGPKVFILGEPFLRKYYTVYDWANKRVGFMDARRKVGSSGVEAPQKGGNAPAASSLIAGAPLA